MRGSSARSEIGGPPSRWRESPAGASLRLAGNTPLPLDSGASVWLVEEGVVEVFATGFAADGAARPRIHLCTTTAGQALFGAAVERDGDHQGLLAVGQPGARLRRLDAAEVRE